MDPTKPLLLFLILVICLAEALDNQLEITSLPNSACQINVSINTPEEHLSLSGDPNKSCDLNIQSTDTSRILISIEIDNATATGTDYIYVERLKPLDQCFHRYVAFKRQLQTCDVYFWHNAIHLRFRGKFNISIDTDKTLQADVFFKCPEENDQEDMAGQAPYCKMKGYESAIQCIRKQSIIRCDVQCPDNCSCILGDREVMYTCPKRNYMHQIKSTILIFPTFNVSSYGSKIGFDFSSNGLTELIVPDPFITIGPHHISFLNISNIGFDFSSNGLTELMSDTFTTIGKHISFLDIRNNRLVSLPPGLLNGLYELDTLWLNNNHLESLSEYLLSGLHNLNQLLLSSNKLVFLPPDLFNGLHELNSLYLSNNYLKSLHADLFNGLHNLSSLSLKNNNFVSLPPELFNGLHALERLNLNNNHLVSLSTNLFYGLQNLHWLNLENNKLVSLPSGLFDSLQDLLWILLINNNLASLPSDLFNSLQELNSLYLSNNYLESLHADLFNGLHKLSSLSLQNNNLVSLPPDLFNGLHTLQRLNLDNNHLESLPTDLFFGLQSLHELDLEKNKLVSLPSRLFDSLQGLRVTSLRKNHLESLPADLFNGLQSLYQLRLEYNYLESLPPGLLNGLNKLYSLSLKNNRLVLLPPGLLNDQRELEWLYLNNNYLESLPADLFNGTQRLFELYLQYNHLVSLPPTLLNGLNKLRSIFLRNNKIISLPPGILNGLHELQNLYLQNNNLGLLPAGLFNHLDKLLILRLDNNSLVSLPAKLFETNILLQILYLSDNQLQFLSFHLFDNLINLVLLDLSGNRLTRIPRLGQMTHLDTLNLVGNSLIGITYENFDGIPETVTMVVDQSVVCVCYMNSSDTCSNTKDRSPYLTCSSLLSLTVLSIFTWILGICATIGNGFVLWWKQSKYDGHKNKVQSILLSNLAVSDLLMGIYMIIIASADAYYGEYFPMNAEEWRSGLICRIASTLAFTSSEASVFFVTLISFDRFINIKFPYAIRKLRAKSTRWSSSVVWAISLTLGLSASISAGRDPEFYDNSHVCIGLPLAQLVRYNTEEVDIETEATWSSSFSHVNFETVIKEGSKEQRSPGLYFSVAVLIGFNMLCFLLILSCYIVIIKTVSQSSKAASRQRDMAEEVRMTVKVSAIVLTDFFCWFPICLIGVLVQAGVVTIPTDTFAWVVTFVLPINSAINPFMYTIGSLVSDKYAKQSSQYSSRVQMQILPISQ